MKELKKASGSRVKSEGRRIDNRKNEILVNKLMVLFVGTVIAITSLMMFYRHLSNYSVNEIIDKSEFLMNSGYVVFGITGALFVAALVVFLFQRGRHADEKLKSINSYNILALASYFFLCAGIYAFYSPGGLKYGSVKMMICFTVICAFLAFVYCLYKTDYFLLTAALSLGCIFVFLTGSAYMTSTTALAGRIALIITAAVLAAVTLAARRNGGYLGDPNLRSIKILEGNKGFLFNYLASLIILCAGVLSFFIPNLSLYIVTAFSAVFLISGIYYTIKMI